ncbi:BTAD domain-containing putative transcriptional regulator, partial [Streptomyces thermocarboxydus]|uniref:BTAD domain-containing putative transcriptional regulator n=1 Tax=Streptomyces thermocarboxydus TaxID=59299 RepID=UPI0031F870D6
MTRRGLRFGLLGTPVLFGGEPTPGQSPPGRAPRTRDGTPVVPVTSPKLRTLLTVLLLDAGRVVSVEALKDALWGGAPPVSALPSLHNHVARLRRLLGEPGRLLTAPTGYVLRVDDGELDVQVFDAHVSAARSARAEGDWERVRRECRAALGLWRGMPLGGPAPEVGGYALVRRLEEARLLLHEWRYDAELALGDESLADLVPELSALAAEHPLREAYHRQLMLALHRTGRQAEALVVHRDLRARLADELGVEPGQPVREAHVEVLRGSGTRDGASRWVRPAQLPPAPAHFVGRADVREGVARVLSGTDATGAVVLSGTAGVGKTALALQVAHNLEERFSGGQLYLNLRATEPGAKPLTTAEALASLLRDLGVCSGDVPEQPDAASALLRSLLAPSRTLLVLDDAVSAAQVRPLLPAGPGCGVLVTSRSPLTALDGAARFPLRPLSDEESAALLCAASGRDGITARHPLVALTGRLPLALRVVAARLAAGRAPQAAAAAPGRRSPRRPAR